MSTHQKITVSLKEGDWVELLVAAGQGYGDGTLYDLDKPAKYRPADWRKRSGAYWRSVNAIHHARVKASSAAKIREQIAALKP